MELGPEIQEKDYYEGSINVTFVQLNPGLKNDRFQIRFWVSSCESNHITFVSQDGVVTVGEALDYNPTIDKGILVTYKDAKQYLYAKKRSDPCAACNKLTLAPVVCFRIYTPAPTREDKASENTGWICTSNGFINENINNGVSWEIKLDNFFEKAPITSTVIVESVLPFQKLELPEPGADQNLITETDDGIRHLDAICLVPNHKRILEISVAVHYGYMLRDEWYLHNSYHSSFNDEFVMDLIYFGYKLHGMKLDELTNLLLKWTDNELEETEIERFNQHMIIFVLSICYFVTRFKYVQDAYVDDAGNRKSIEQFSRCVAYLKGGDCEDFAWYLQSLFEYIKYRTVTGGDLDLFTQAMTVFVPCSALVSASCPQMKPTEENVKFEELEENMKTIEDESTYQNNFKNYHMTCLLLVAEHVFPGVIKPSFKIGERSLKKLNHLVAEGTSCTYPVTTRLIPSATRPVLEELQSLVNEEKDIMVTMSNKNFHGATVMYGSVLQIATDYLWRNGKTNSILFICEYSEKEGDKPIFAPPEGKLDVINFKAVPITRLPVHNPETWKKHNFDPPPVKLLLKKDKIRLEEVNIPNASENNFYYRWGKIDERGAIPYICWNNLCNVKPGEMIALVPI
jgi:hypothetical protein